MVPERLPHEPLYAVARARLAAMFLGNGKTQPARFVAATAGSCEYRKACIPASPRFFEHSAVFLRIAEPVRLSEGEAWIGTIGGNGEEP